MKKPKSLFDKVVPDAKLHQAFATIRTFPGNEPTRLLMDMVFEDFEDIDGNFVEQFQTTGFDSRTFELFLFALFLECDLVVKRPKQRPDFLLEKDGLIVALEATTSNKTQVKKTPGTSAGESDISSSTPSDQLETRATRPHPTDAIPPKPTDAELSAHMARVEHEMPIKVGGALYSKLTKRYWNVPEVAGRPFVIAVEAFHSEDSLFFSSSGVADYLFGVKQSWEHSPEGKLVVTNSPREFHKLGTKQIPSGFFSLPESENVSAVLFTNSGTTAKFTRLGFQLGLHRGNVMIARSGYWPDPDPNSTSPRAQSYTLDEPPYEEWWGEGVTVFHNPSAKFPLPHDFFQSTVQVYKRGNDIVAAGSALSPYISRTVTVSFDDELFRPVDLAESGVGTLLQLEFDELEPQRAPTAGLIAREIAWFSTRERDLLGVVFEDRVDKDYGYAILGKDLNGRFRGVAVEVNIAESSSAREQALERLSEIRASGARVFPQGDENDD